MRAGALLGSLLALPALDKSAFDLIYPRHLHAAIAKGKESDTHPELNDVHLALLL